MATLAAAKRFPSLILTPSQVSRLPRQTTIPIDVSWFMPNNTRDPDSEFVTKRIPGARRLNLDLVASKHPLGLKHMMPSPSAFAEACEIIGVEPSSHVVLYDTVGVFSSPRALFMFKAFGHRDASILNGGLMRWEMEGYPISSESPSVVEKSIYPRPTLRESLLRDYQQIVENSRKNPLLEPDAAVVLDARSKGRFSGQDPEPRPGLSSGHIPHSLSLPFTELVECPPGAPYTILRDQEDLLAKVKIALGTAENVNDVIVDKTRTIVNSCGSGMTAGVLWLALQELGIESAIYDESWTGYAMREESEIVKT